MVVVEVVLVDVVVEVLDVEVLLVVGAAVSPPHAITTTASTTTIRRRFKVTPDPRHARYRRCPLPDRTSPRATRDHDSRLLSYRDARHG